RLQIVDYDRPFNFSEKITLGVLAARGDFLLLLNDDIEVLPDGWRAAWPRLTGRSSWIESLLMYAGCHDVGAVGARMYFGDLRLQHAGVVFHGVIPSHVYRGFPSTHVGYFGNVLAPCNYLTLTAACVMTRRDVFDAVGGFSPMLPVNYNDVDFGMKLHRAGYRSVYDPNAELLHFESSTRETVVHDHELARLRERWASVMEDDPYY